jgi:DNA-binding MarR family transcriptional regulator
MMYPCTIFVNASRCVACGGLLGYVSGVLERDSQEQFYERFAALLRCIRGVAADAYAAIDIGSTQAKFLRHIGENSHISQAQLARATNTAPTLTGRVVEPLIEHGWVRRRRSSEDRRQYVLELTASGKRMRERVETARRGVIQSLGRVLDGKDAEDFERIAAKILAAFGGPGVGGAD